MFVTISSFVSRNQILSDTTMAELWAEALTEIKERIGKQNFEAWIKPIRFVHKNKNEIVLEVPNKFFRDWLTEHYLHHIETAALRDLLAVDAAIAGGGRRAFFAVQGLREDAGGGGLPRAAGTGEQVSLPDPLLFDGMT